MSRDQHTEQSVVHEADYGLRHPEHFRRCGWCGSVHPVDLLIARAAGALKDVDRSVDWKYGWPHKIYLSIEDQLGQLDWLGGTSGGPKRSPEEIRAGGYKTPDELTDEEREACERSGINLSTYAGVRIGKRDRHHAKFYSVHTLEPFLSDQERDQLFALVGYTFGWVNDDPANGRIRFSPYDYGTSS